MQLKTRHQEMLALAVFLALATIVVEIWPRLDIAVSAYFFDGRSFVGHQWDWANLAYHGVPPLGAWLLGVAAVMALLPLLPGRWGRRLVKPWLQRRAIVSLLVVVFGVGLLVHSALKDNWGRPRPEDVQPFGGPKVSQAPLQPSTQCARNCSFVSGHPAAGFALIGLGLFGTRRTRWRWWAIGTFTGAVIGLARVAQGRHFFADVVFCMLALWLVCVITRELWLRAAVAQRAFKRQKARNLQA